MKARERGRIGNAVAGKTARRLVGACVFGRVG